MPVGVLLDVTQRCDHVEDAKRPGRLQPEVFGQLGRIPRSLGEGAEDSGPLRHLKRARHRHREQRLTDRRRHLAQQQPDPLHQPVGDRS
jgi:hypothetical protein